MNQKQVNIRLRVNKDAQDLRDRFICSMGPRQIKTCSIWESCLAAGWSPVKTYKNEAAALRALAPWLAGDGLELNSELNRAGYVVAELVEVEG